MRALLPLLGAELRVHASVALLSPSPMNLTLSLPREIAKRSRVIVAVESAALAREYAATAGAKRPETGSVTSNLTYTSVRRLYNDMLAREARKDAWPYDLLVIDRAEAASLYRDLAFSLWRTKRGKKPRLLLLGSSIREPLEAEKTVKVPMNRFRITKKFAQKARGGKALREHLISTAASYFAKTARFTAPSILLFLESDNAVRSILPDLRKAIPGAQIVSLTGSSGGEIAAPGRRVYVASDAARGRIPLRELAAVIDSARHRDRNYTDWGRVLYVTRNATLNESDAVSELLGYGGPGIFYSALPRDTARPPATERRTGYPESMILGPILSALAEGADPGPRLRPAFGERRIARALLRLEKLGYISKEGRSRTVERRPELRAIAPDLAAVVGVAFGMSGKRLRNRNMLYLLAATIANYQAGVLRYPHEALTADRKKTREYFSTHFMQFSSSQPLETSLRALLELPINQIVERDDIERAISEEARRLSLRKFEVARVLETYAALVDEKGLGALVYTDRDVHWALYYFAQAYAQLYPERAFVSEDPVQGTYRRGVGGAEQNYLLSQDLSFWTPRLGDPSEHLPQVAFYLNLLPRRRPGKLLGTMTLWVPAPDPESFFDIQQPERGIVDVELVRIDYARPEGDTGSEEKSSIDWATLGRAGLPGLRRDRFSLSRLKTLKSLSMLSKAETREQKISRLSKGPFPRYPRVPPPGAYRRFVPEYDTSPFLLDPDAELEGDARFRSAYDEGYLQLVDTESARAVNNTHRIEIDASLVRYATNGASPVDRWEDAGTRRDALEVGTDARGRTDWAAVRRELGLEPEIFELASAKSLLSLVGSRDSGTFRVFDPFAQWGVSRGRVPRKVSTISGSTRFRLTMKNLCAGRKPSASLLRRMGLKWLMDRICVS